MAPPDTSPPASADQGTVAGAPAVRRLPPNTRGRDFVVGDVHGHVSRLEAVLDRLGFDRSQDRLLSVGDLIDRGPESERALELLSAPWFYAVRGNHEQMMLDAVSGGMPDPAMQELWFHNGGRWFEKADPAATAGILAAIARLPYALQVDRAEGQPIGIVHADLPGGDWPAATARLAAGEPDALSHVLWSRARARDVNERALGHPPRRPLSIAGLDRVYFGHTPMSAPVACGNTRWLDTGVFLRGGRLTITEVASDAVHASTGAAADWQRLPDD